MKKRISPEDDKSIVWEPMTEEKLYEYWQEKIAKKKSKKVEMYDGWYGAVVTTKKRKK